MCMWLQCSITCCHRWLANCLSQKGQVHGPLGDAVRPLPLSVGGVPAPMTVACTGAMLLDLSSIASSADRSKALAVAFGSFETSSLRTNMYAAALELLWKMKDSFSITTWL